MIRSKHLFLTFIIAFSLIACVFADDDPEPVQNINKRTSFTMQVVRDEIAPLFVLQGGNSPLSLTSVGRDNTPIPTDMNNLPTYVLVSNSDLSAEDVKVYVRVTQGNLAYQEVNLIISVSANALRLDGTGTEDNEKTDEPVVGDISEGYSIDIDGDSIPDFSTSLADTDTSSVSFNVSYSGKPVPSVFNGQHITICSCSFTWPKKESLIVGSYYANVSLICTVDSGSQVEP